MREGIRLIWRILGGWFRGDRNDYDAWGKLVGDERWSYAGLLPYFKKCETHHTATDDVSVHGFDGPITTSSVTSSGRKYPLRSLVKNAWATLGVEEISDINAGDPLGLGEICDNRRDNLRQSASVLYSLEGVELWDKTLVKRVIIEERGGGKVATGVELADGRFVSVRKEVIISAGAYRTPQVLLLSGVGAKEELEKFEIKQVVDLPEVGKNLHDHMGLNQWYVLINFCKKAL